MDDNRRNLIDVLRAGRELFARRGNDFTWSSWTNADAAIGEVNGMIAALESGFLPGRLNLSVLFAPTGPIQEVSMSSGSASTSF